MFFLWVSPFLAVCSDWIQFRVIPKDRFMRLITLNEIE